MSGELPDFLMSGEFSLSFFPKRLALSATSAALTPDSSNPLSPDWSVVDAFLAF